MSNPLLKRFVYVALILVVLTGAASAQVANTLRTPTPSGSLGEDSLVIAPTPRRWDVAALEVAALNVMVWAFGHYALDGYWTQISLETMDLNLRHGFEWDGNQFKNNFSSHPYHGNTYFNAARTNGMNFWESVPYAFTGSLTWELFMESEFPSWGDLVMTTIGGTSLGEMFYRFSEQLLDDRTGGWERFWRELGGAALNPVGGFNRLVRGDMFARHGSANHIRNPFKGYIAWGTRSRFNTSDVGKVQVNPSFALTVGYGNAYETKPSRTPYDYFTFRMWYSKGVSKSNVSMLQYGVLAGNNHEKAGGRINHLLGLFQHFDYVNIDSAFNFGGVTLAPGLVSQWINNDTWRFRTGAHLGWLILGGSNNEYFTNSQGRNYNYTTGFKSRLNLGVRHRALGDLLVDYMYFWMTSLSELEGRDFIHQLIATYNKQLYKGLGLGLEYYWYNRTGDYPDFPAPNQSVNGPRILITYGFY